MINEECKITDRGYSYKGIMKFKRFMCQGGGFTGYGFSEQDAYSQWKEAKYIGEIDE